jgi:hypothetical protein
MQDVPCAYLKNRNETALMEQFIYPSEQHKQATNPHAVTYRSTAALQIRTNFSKIKHPAELLH